jgi:hypothetical protein
MPFIHWSPEHIPVGAFILSVAQLGGPSRSFGGDYDYAVELGMYDPRRVYVMQTAQLDPRQWFGTFGFTRPKHYMYEVEPEDLGPDTDPGRIAMNSLSCARARVIRCLYSPTSADAPEQVTRSA